MLVLLVDCHCLKGTAPPPCISSEHHVVPLFAEPPCIASDCELWTILHLVETLSTCPRPNHLSNSYEMQCKRSSQKGTTIISSSKGSAVSVILGWGCKSNLHSYLPYWLMDLVTHDAVDYHIMSSLCKVINETLPIFCAFFMQFR